MKKYILYFAVFLLPLFSSAQITIFRGKIVSIKDYDSSFLIKGVSTSDTLNIISPKSNNHDSTYCKMVVGNEYCFELEDRIGNMMIDPLPKSWVVMSGKKIVWSWKRGDSIKDRPLYAKNTSENYIRSCSIKK